MDNRRIEKFSFSIAAGFSWRNSMVENIIRCRQGIARGTALHAAECVKMIPEKA
jgi:hypothetical protein